MTFVSDITVSLAGAGNMCAIETELDSPGSE